MREAVPDGCGHLQMHGLTRGQGHLVIQHHRPWPFPPRRMEGQSRTGIGSQNGPRTEECARVLVCGAAAGCHHTLRGAILRDGHPRKSEPLKGSARSRNRAQQRGVAVSFLRRDGFGFHADNCHRMRRAIRRTEGRPGMHGIQRRVRPVTGDECERQVLILPGLHFERLFHSAVDAPRVDHLRANRAGQRRIAGVGHTHHRRHLRVQPGDVGQTEYLDPQGTFHGHGRIDALAEALDTQQSAKQHG